MNGLRQVLLGFLAALLSSALILGSLSLALLQGGTSLALAPSSSPTAEHPSIDITILPGEPTLTALPPTPTETFPSPVCPPPAGWIQKAVGPDDTMQSLADDFGLPVEVFANANCLRPSSQLMGGMILSVPPPTPTSTVTSTPLPSATRKPTRTPLPCGKPAGWTTYTVRRGDNLYSISQAFYTSVAALQRANCLSGILIKTGQLLYVPNVATRTPVPSATQVPTATSLPPTQPPTSAPTTAVPPTAQPTTAIPTTVEPTTVVPTTVEPTTAVPPTPAPSTEPIIPAPTTQPPPNPDSTG